MGLTILQVGLEINNNHRTLSEINNNHRILSEISNSHRIQSEIVVNTLLIKTLYSEVFPQMCMKAKFPF